MTILLALSVLVLSTSTITASESNDGELVPENVASMEISVRINSSVFFAKMLIICFAGTDAKTSIEAAGDLDTEEARYRGGGRYYGRGGGRYYGGGFVSGGFGGGGYASYPVYPAYPYYYPTYPVYAAYPSYGGIGVGGFGYSSGGYYRYRSRGEIRNISFRRPRIDRI